MILFFVFFYYWAIEGYFLSQEAYVKYHFNRKCVWAAVEVTNALALEWAILVINSSDFNVLNNTVRKMFLKLTCRAFPPFQKQDDAGLATFKHYTSWREARFARSDGLSSFHFRGDKWQCLSLLSVLTSFWTLHWIWHICSPATKSPC